MIKVAIAEDDPIMRDALSEIIGSAPDIEVVGVFECEDDAVFGVVSSRPQVVLVDIQLNPGNGLRCIQRIKAELPDIQFIVITIFEEEEKVFESLKCGATGYILKGSSMEEYLHAIRVVVSGGSSLSPKVARKLVEFYGDRKPSTEEKYDLTDRERAVLDLLAKGYMYKQVAEHLHISMDTVRTHIRHIYEKLQVHSRTEALNKVFPR